MDEILIISGGQTGVDRGALDFALGHGISCGGWCPAGRESEDGPIPERYPLREVETTDYNERTRRNVRDADATLIITREGVLEAGTSLTIEECRHKGHDFLHLEFSHTELKDPAILKGSAAEARAWIEMLKPAILNIAGNRERSSPGIQQFTKNFLELIFSEGK
jgi:hypothetical protein